MKCFPSCEMKMLSSYLSHQPLESLPQFVRATDKMFDQYKINNKRTFFSLINYEQKLEHLAVVIKTKMIECNLTTRKC